MSWKIKTYMTGIEPKKFPQQATWQKNYKYKMMRISPTPSVIMPTTHWRCQLGQSQELGQRNLKKH
jgi:hypothetical protein